MKALELYKFIKENNIEFHHRYNSETEREDVLIWLTPYEMQEFAEMLKGQTPEYGFDTTLINGSFALFMNEVCEFFDIDINEIFEKA